MKRLSILFILMGLFITGCTGGDYSQQDDKAYSSMTGYVMDKENGRILVVDDTPQDFSDNGGQKEFYNAIWFSNVPKDIKKGDKVEIWFDVVQESYPGQSQAKDFALLEDTKPEGADLSLSQALNKILTFQDMTSVMAVYYTEYNGEDDQWIIHLKEIMKEEGKILEFKIGDQQSGFYT